MSRLGASQRGRVVTIGGIVVAVVLVASSLLLSGCGDYAQSATSAPLKVDLGPQYGVESFVSPNAQTGGEFGFSVGISGTTLVVGAPRETSQSYTWAGNAYTFNTTTDTSIATLANTDAQAGGLFGNSVAINGTTAVVGASAEKASGDTGAGHAYLYNATTGHLIHTLTSAHPQVDGAFGWSVAISGSFGVVGAPFENASGQPGSGRAYTFNATSGKLISTLTSPDAILNGDFGYSVGISGATVVVGAPGENASGLSYVGNAYLYNVTTGKLIETLHSPNPYDGGMFGGSVGISVPNVVVGAPGEAVSGVIDSGHAYIFDTKTSKVATLTDPYPPVTVPGNLFGDSVAISGDRVIVAGGAPSSLTKNVWTYAAPSGSMLFIGNFSDPGIGSVPPGSGDSYGASVAVSGNLVTVGAWANYSSPNSQFRPGTAYVFDDAPLRISAPPSFFCTLACFGWSIDLTGSTVMLGAPGDTVSGQTDAGEVWVLNTMTGVLTALANPNPQADGYFGWSVAISGSRIVVGAPGEPGSTSGGESHHSIPTADTPGQAYVFNAKSGTLVATLASPNAQSGGEFGYSVAISGSRVVVGAPNESVDGVSQAGHAYVFSTNGALIEGLADPNYQPGGEFGTSVGIAGTLVAVGAPFDTLKGYSATGGVYTFRATGDKYYATLTSPSMQANEEFGASVALSGTTVVVGAPNATASGDPSAGYAYTFNGKTGALISVLTDPNAQTGGNFGSSVGISGTTAVVGAEDEASSGFSDAGNAYTFDAATGDQLLSFTSPNAQSDGYFGGSVAVGGTTVVIGAWGEAATTNSQVGHAYFYLF